MSLHPAKTENKPDEAPAPEHIDFAAAMTAAEFGNNFPHPSSATFRDRLPPETIAPIVSNQFHRGRHRRLVSWRVSG